MTNWQVGLSILGGFVSVAILFLGVWKFLEVFKTKYEEKLDSFLKTIWKRYDDLGDLVEDKYLKKEMFNTHVDYMKRDFTKIDGTMKEMRADSIRLEAKIDKILSGMAIK